MVSVYSLRPLDFTVFPTILLVVTLLRLALNIASTRVVLRALQLFASTRREETLPILERIEGSGAVTAAADSRSIADPAPIV